MSDDPVVLVELTRTLDGDPPGTRWALAKIIADALVDGGFAVRVGGATAARAHLRPSTRTQEPAGAAGAASPQASEQEVTVGSQKSAGGASP